MTCDGDGGDGVEWCFGCEECGGWGGLVRFGVGVEEEVVSGYGYGVLQDRKEK